MNESLQCSDNPIEGYSPECSKCNSPLMAKNTVTGQELCGNKKCENYNAEILKQIFIDIPYTMPPIYTQTHSLKK